MKKIKIKMFPFRHHLNRPYTLHRPNGFTLVELLVVVSIIAILSVSSVLGFGALGDTLRAREAAGFIQDTVKTEELKVLRGDFEKTIVHFPQDYMIVEEWAAGASDDLFLIMDPTCSESGRSAGYRIQYKKSGSLYLRGGDGEAIYVKPVNAGDDPCITFRNSAAQEQDYWLTGESFSSVVIRLVHFNLKRDEPNPFTISANAGSRIEILAPYARRRLFKATDDTEHDSLVIGVSNGNANESIIFYGSAKSIK